MAESYCPKQSIQTPQAKNIFQTEYEHVILSRVLWTSNISLALSFHIYDHAALGRRRAPSESSWTSVRISLSAQGCGRDHTYLKLPAQTLILDSEGHRLCHTHSLMRSTRTAMTALSLRMESQPPKRRVFSSSRTQKLSPLSGVL